MASVKYSELEMAMQFVSGDIIFDACAYISRKNGKICWESDDSGLEEELPEDVGDLNLYAEVPSQWDLGLGKPLVLEFTTQVLPEKYDEIDSMFRRKGAYSRYKDFLVENRLLDAWYEFEQSAIEKALVEWAKDEGFTVEK